MNLLKTLKDALEAVNANNFRVRDETIKQRDLEEA